MRRVALGLGAIAALTGAVPALAGEVVITVTDLRSSKGVVRACMTTGTSMTRNPASTRRMIVSASGKSLG